jgi:hypothetical protein
MPELTPRKHSLRDDRPKSVSPSVCVVWMIGSATHVSTITDSCVALGASYGMCAKAAIARNRLAQIMILDCSTARQPRQRKEVVAELCRVASYPGC